MFDSRAPFLAWIIALDVSIFIFFVSFYVAISARPPSRSYQIFQEDGKLAAIEKISFWFLNSEWERGSKRSLFSGHS